MAFPLIAVAAIASALSSGFLGFSQAAQAETSADIAKQQAKSAKQQSQRDATDFRRRQSRVLAASRARAAGSGITAAGSPLLVTGDIAAEAARGESRILEGGSIEEARLRDRSKLQSLAARQSRIGGILGAGGSFLNRGAPLFAEEGD